jgi:DNA-binding response OmpR family regulator
MKATRILIVEDNTDIADIVARRLRLDAMEPSVCASGAAAKELLARERFDAVLLDVMMPDVDGYEVLRHIRSMPALDDMPVIFLTSKGRRDDIERAYAMGANAYVVKPFGPHDLVRTLRACLGRARPAPPPNAI